MIGIRAACACFRAYQGLLLLAQRKAKLVFLNKKGRNRMGDEI